MLQAKVVLHPYGEKLNIDIGNDVYIANMGGGTPEEADYVYFIHVKASEFSGEVNAHGVIRGHKRNQNSLVLLGKILNDWGCSSCGASAKFMDRVLESCSSTQN